MRDSANFRQRLGVHSQRVHYLSYRVEPTTVGRVRVPAGVAKVEYLRGALLRAGCLVRLVSTALADKGYAPRVKVRLSETETHVYLPSLRLPHITRPFQWLQIAHYLLTAVKGDDVVVAYHSLAYMGPIRLARRLKKFQLVLEVNDVYHAVSATYANRRASEEAFIRGADAYLFMNRIAAAAFADGKPHLISYGSYEVPERRADRPDDGRTHVVYSGIIENRRRAASLAVDAARHLDEQFVVHILGFGDEEEISALQRRVEALNSEVRREAVRFHGALYGQEFTDFLHGCHVGLSTHAYGPDDSASADLTFPSKIPVYMAHDLKVVSPDLPCVVESPFAAFVSFYTDHSPQSIAAAIRATVESANTASTPAEVVAELDRGFEIEALFAPATTHVRRPT